MARAPWPISSAPIRVCSFSPARGSAPVPVFPVIAIRRDSGSAGSVRVVDVSADSYYGAGYQDIVNRRPRIDATCRDLEWQPTIGMEQTLRGLFDFYRDQLPSARHLIDDATAGEAASDEEVRHRSIP